MFFKLAILTNITSRNNAPILNFGGGFRCKSEYPWCIIEVKSKHFPTVFKKIEKNKVSVDNLTNFENLKKFMKISYKVPHKPLKHKPTF
ncbi:Uncharacterized protein FWK35_00020741 [Aphis craccivora]|uniref:Uncharacterized protein n=1 Tax=Aphis craccivora TaxID=307492 RepID=A0A6G0Y4A6_APHCR|nr:Uncharacterized protein FWK35_00020741 [Aphis craccivora]